MQIFVKNSRTYVLNVEVSDTVMSVKEKIQDLDAIPVKYLSLVYAGHVLEDDRTLADYLIKKEATITYRVRLVPAQTQ
jgi:ubiquitin C